MKKKDLEARIAALETAVRALELAADDVVEAVTATPPKPELRIPDIGMLTPDEKNCVPFLDMLTFAIINEARITWCGTVPAMLVRHPDGKVATITASVTYTERLAFYLGTVNHTFAKQE